jgi:LPXTG-motif cell wall-anchored protein
VLYTVTVSNTGNTSLTGIDVQDGLDDTFPYATITLTDPATDPFLPATVLAPGASVVSMYSVLVQADGAPGPYNTMSTVAALSPSEDVSATANVEVTLDVTYDLAVSIDAPASAAPGSSYAQKITVMNKGPAAAFGPVLVSVTLDPSTSFQAFSGEGWNCSAAGDQVTCSYEDKINAGVSTDVSIVMLVSAVLGESLTFSASVGAANSDDDVNPLNNVLATHLSVDQLPETGVSSDRLALTGLLLLLLGSVLVIGARKRRSEELA